MPTKLHLLIPILLLALFTLFSCSGGEMEQKKVTYSSLKNIPDTAWDKLSKKRMFFGHQSVGYNIITGIEQLLKEHPDIKLNIKKTRDVMDMEVPVLAHDWIGSNMKPSTKTQAFKDTLRGGIGKKVDIAFMKFCYVDITSNTNVNELFNIYKETVEELKNEYPSVTFIHLTTPLTAKPQGFQAVKQTGKNIIKKILGWPVFDHKDNINRNEFNELMKQEYSGTEPIFDLAAIEFTKPDRTKSGFENDGKIIPTLFNGYTYDGGHLNEQGSRLVAAKMLIFLINLV